MTTKTTESEALTEADRSQTRGSVASVTAGETATKTTNRMSNHMPDAWASAEEWAEFLQLAIPRCEKSVIVSVIEKIRLNSYENGYDDGASDMEKS